MSKQFGLLVGLLIFLPFFLSCGDSQYCSLRMLVDPGNASADHNAASPGNAAQFTASPTFPSGCPIPPIPALTITWSVSDPSNVTLTSTPGSNQVTATCVNATSSTVTATGGVAADPSGSTIKGTAKLKCN